MLLLSIEIILKSSLSLYLVPGLKKVINKNDIEVLCASSKMQAHQVSLRHADYLNHA